MIMEKKLLSEINRYREIVGLPLINEAVTGGGLVGKLLDVLGFVDNVADETASAIVKLETEAAADTTGEIAARLARVQDELVQLAEAAGIPGARNSSIQDLIYFLKRSADKTVKTDLIKILNRNFDEANKITTEVIKNNKVLLSEIDKLDAQVLRKTLEDTLGLKSSYLDEIINTFYKNVTDVGQILEKLGIKYDDATTETIRKEILSGLESSIANPEIKKYVKFIGGKDGSDKMKVIYNKSFAEINKMVGGITDANAESYFNKELSKLITQLKDAGMTKDALTQFNETVKGVVNWLTGYKTIQKSKSSGKKLLYAGLALPRAYVLGWGTISLITGAISLGETFISSDETLLKQYLQTEEGGKLYNEGNLTKFNEKFNQWKSALYQGMVSAVKKFVYPISQLGGIDLNEKSNFTKEELDKAFKSLNSSNTETTSIYVNQLDDKDNKKGFKSWLKTEYYKSPNSFTTDDEKVMVQDNTDKNIYYYTPYDSNTKKDLPKITFEFKDGKFQEKK